MSTKQKTLLLEALANHCQRIDDKSLIKASLIVSALSILLTVAIIGGCAQ